MATNDLNDDTLAGTPGDGAAEMPPNDLTRKQDTTPADPDLPKKTGVPDDPTTRGRPRGGVVDL